MGFGALTAARVQRRDDDAKRVVGTVRSERTMPFGPRRDDGSEDAGDAASRLHDIARMWSPSLQERFKLKA